MHYVAVAPLAVSRRDTYTYRTKAELPAGALVSIPYAGRRGSGVVIGPAEPDGRAKDADPTGERLPAWQLRFGRELAAAYLAPLGQTLGLFLPKWRDGLAPEIAGSAAPPGPELRTDPPPGRGGTGQTLVLVPERAMLRRLPAGALRFSATDPAAERRTVWKQARGGSAKLVFGTRSALFLPWHGLSAVTVLHEDELGHQNDRTPRFHAREAARLLAEAQGARLTLVSPAPSLRAWALADRPRLNLPDIPPVTLLSPRYERYDDPLPYGFAEKLRGLAGSVLVHAVQGKVRVLRDAVSAKGISDATVGGHATVLAGKRYDNVVSLDVDAILARPGFAVTERAVALLRKSGGLVRPGGTFLVYSKRQDHPAFDALGKPYGAFLDAELEGRTALSLPPVEPLVRIVTDEAERPKIENVLATLPAGKRAVRYATDAGTLTVSIKGDPERLRALIAPERRISVEY